MRVKVHRKALIAILRSDEMEADLLARAERIATAAGPGMEASVKAMRFRARAQVVTATPEAQKAEATNRSLSSAVSAGA